MTDVIKLNTLRPNGGGIITEVSHSDASMTRRLDELGFTAGAPLRCVGRSPAGGMGAYLIKGAVIALRDSDAEAVSVLIKE